ncbi:hypothetical protein [Bacillus vallismortis]|uniref:hypothetical protein n=1 Tax=Bacillus vallismortis TaxID=72361 RepID=UPI000287D0E2|nr:hypothetical protein [Bacillus vallismortis]MBG9771345.1 hypothetical protein [Bacillus vallismortis]MEC1268409.1 hypothetical protein [Bacillus vallismortis]QAV09991.1 hypothetical protein BV11031_16020 [Bacillus vallismortis]
MRNFITALPIVLLLGFSFVSFMFQFEHLVYFRLALGLFSLAGLYMIYKMKTGIRYFIIYLYASWIVLAAVTVFEEPIFSSFFFGGLVMTMGYLTYMLIYLGMKQDRDANPV